MDEWVCDCREHSFLCRLISPWVKKMWYVSRFLETASSVTGSSCFNLPCFGPSLKFVLAAQLYYGHPPSTDTSLLRTICLVPGERKPLCLNSTGLIQTPRQYGHFLWPSWCPNEHECLGRYTYTGDLSSDLFQAKKTIWNNWANVFIWCLRKLKINYKDSPLPAIVACCLVVKGFIGLSHLPSPTL